MIAILLPFDHNPFHNYTHSGAASRRVYAWGKISEVDGADELIGTVHFLAQRSVSPGAEVITALRQL